MDGPFADLHPLLSKGQAVAEAMRAGKSVQAFSGYGPERRGAPMRASTRIDDKPIRRHDSVTRPAVAVVLDTSLVREEDVTKARRVPTRTWRR